MIILTKRLQYLHRSFLLVQWVLQNVQERHLIILIDIKGKRGREVYAQAKTKILKNVFLKQMFKLCTITKVYTRH
nr:unnamed protein product [Callosobruchus analis]